MEILDILDVTVIEPRLKHPTIFEKFDALLPGEAFIINNDHDPKPLYYQLLAERGQIFTWDYLEKGPETWQVKIAKKTDAENSETIGEIVAKDYRKAQVFKNMGIDFCCGGKKTIAEVCEKKGIDPDEVERQLAAVKGDSANSETDFQKWDLGFLSDYIINTHHQYVQENTTFILELAQKVARVHGERHQELIRVAELFSRVGKDLTLHMLKEEKILFPFIKELAQIYKTGGKVPVADFGKVSVPIQVMDSEHELVGGDFETIRELTSNYQLPADACTSYTILFKKLEEYENDLHRHVHLESNILFPKAIQLEKELS
ncbi:iron-sulfur cluster repair di-iron protein [Mucilaginibacter sp.]|uniref:iron-sulfur cluster repair di-iron protein n=1 Tax=Mucilaginibacter sp. TaxID=1882438 RepID=UPI0028499DBE|nr:iron-sulfur cluster repair di-iron protein [Mucilaginibacter sp.]MDR3694778.1 iron-sulfur cluster repair di-iron protein [Mucilaginibacter sp.]